MKLPEIRIRYAFFLSPIINFNIQSRSEKKGEVWKPPTRQEISKKIDEFCDIWEPVEKKILTGMCEFAGLRFYQNVIDVHVVDAMKGAFSQPLVVSSRLPTDEFVDLLTHELLHRLLSDNQYKLNLGDIVWNKMFPEIKNRNTQNHILVHAVHKHVYLGVLKSKERLTRDIEFSKKLDGYYEAWEIVERRGYKELIDEFKKYYPRG